MPATTLLHLRDLRKLLHEPFDCASTRFGRLCGTFGRCSALVFVCGYMRPADVELVMKLDRHSFTAEAVSCTELVLERDYNDLCAAYMLHFGQQLPQRIPSARHLLLDQIYNAIVMDGLAYHTTTWKKNKEKMNTTLLKLPDESERAPATAERREAIFSGRAAAGVGGG